MTGFLVTSRKTSANTSGRVGPSDLAGRMNSEPKTEPGKGIFQPPTPVRLAPKRRWKIDAVTREPLVLPESPETGPRKRLKRSGHVVFRRQGEPGNIVPLPPLAPTAGLKCESYAL